MIIEPDPLQPFDVPANADFVLRFRTSFTSQQVTDATKVLRLYGPGGQEASVAGVAAVTEWTAAITPGLLAPGRWTFRPEITVASKLYAWAESGTMDVLASGYSRAGAGC